MFRSLFKRAAEPQRTSRTVLSGPRIPRHSSGWAAMLKHLKEEQSLRVLDIGPTSPQNINFLTGLGHSVYMADVVHEAFAGPQNLPSTGSQSGSWIIAPQEEGGEPGFDVEGFFDQNLNFAGREFDVVLLWTTLDYIPQGLVQPLVRHLHTAVRRGGKIFAIFHTRTTGPETAFYRYHLTDSDIIELQETEVHPVLRASNTRSIEKLFSQYSGHRFFLAKDNFYEVIITR